MKKLLTLALSVLSIGFIASSVEAKKSASSPMAVTANAAEPQIRVVVGNGNRRRNRRVYRTRRISPNGRRVITRTYRRNGTVVTRRRPIRPYRRYRRY